MRSNDILCSYRQRMFDRLTWTPEEIDRRLDSEVLQLAIRRVLKTLSYCEREIIKLRYGLGDDYTYTWEEIGHIFKVTRERMRQIEAKAIKKMRAELVSFAE